MKPSHHRPDGFVNPWGSGGADRTAFDMMKWMWQRVWARIPPNPPSAAFPRAEPRIAKPHVSAAETRCTWIGHASFLIQTPSANVLTDPIWSPRASPVPWAGPLRMTQPGVHFEELPPIDVVLLSHDHYDHFDVPTIRRIVAMSPDAQWVAPLGHASLLRALGAMHIRELDWWDVADPAGLRITATPARHWSRRVRSRPGQRLWCGFAIEATPDQSVFFAGDSGYGPHFREIAERLGPFAVNILPVGAYEPRWFMAPAHMNPEDAVRAWIDMGRHGTFIPMHWGAFRLTDEDPLEPPDRTRAAWLAEGLPPERLRVLALGETLVDARITHG